MSLSWKKGEGTEEARLAILKEQAEAGCPVSGIGQRVGIALRLTIIKSSFPRVERKLFD